MKRRLFLLMSLFAAAILAGAMNGPRLTFPAALADSDKDHDRARQILAKKEILPLDQVLAKVHTDVPGDVIDVELEEEDKIWIYEFKIIEPSGKVVKVNADAKTGAILKTRRK